MSRDVTTATDLIRHAAALYDDPSTGLAQLAHRAWRGGFGSGAMWMRKVQEQLRGESVPAAPRMYNWMGFFKYGLACLAAAIPVVPAIIWKQYASILLAIPLFYAVEVQMVFLFPVALDGSCSPFRDSLEWTARAGGTIAAMRIVMLLAVVMLFGGLAGRGFVRSWCIGCAAVCIWYERLRNSAGGNQAGSLAGTDAA